MVKSNHLIGDMVYVEMQGFKGLARVGGVENKSDGTYYYLSSGPTGSRAIVYAHETEVHPATPISNNQLTGPRYLIGRSANERN